MATKKILQDFRQENCEQIPTIKNPTPKDLEELEAANKIKNKSHGQQAFIKLLLTDCRKKLGVKDYSKDILEIPFEQIDNIPFITEAKIRFCETVIDLQKFNRITTLQRFTSDLHRSGMADAQQAARIQLLDAGLSCMKKDYLAASNGYLAASRLESYVKDQKKQVELFNKAVAFAFVATHSPERFKLICKLYLNEFSRKSHLREILHKMYNNSMLPQAYVQEIQRYLPEFFTRKDSNQLSPLEKAVFAQNMFPIISIFSSVSFDTLNQLLGMKIEKILLHLEQLDHSSGVEIDMISKYVYIRSEPNNQEMIKGLFEKVDQVLGQ